MFENLLLLQIIVVSELRASPCNKSLKLKHLNKAYMLIVDIQAIISISRNDLFMLSHRTLFLSSIFNGLFQINIINYSCSKSHCFGDIPEIISTLQRRGYHIFA